MSLNLQNLQISIEDKQIVHDFSLEIKPGEIHVIMGPNGSGKSTLANALMGHPKYTLTKGVIMMGSKDISQAKVDERAKAGLFLSMQYLPEISGVTITNFLRTAKASLIGEKINPIKFYRELLERMKSLGIDESFAGRYLNVGFSGGEKKRMEILQLLTLDPKYAILDETDSGLDVDALKVVADGINKFHNNKKGVLLVTHYQRILNYIKPNFVHVMKNGKIVESGGADLADAIEQKGYADFISEI